MPQTAVFVSFLPHDVVLDLGLACMNTHCRQRTLGNTSCSQGLLGRCGRVEYL